MKNKTKIRSSQRLQSSEVTHPHAEPLEVQAHYLLCAICIHGGCSTPPAGRRTVDRLLKVLWEYPYVPLKITADVDVNRAHYLDVYANRGIKPLPENFLERKENYITRKQDLETLRRMGLAPGTILPAYVAYSIIFNRIPTLEGICFSTSYTAKSRLWRECPQARKEYYERIVSYEYHNLEKQTELGEAMDGKGIWALLRPRTRQDMREAKTVSSQYIIQHADHLFIRPNHVLCILCTAKVEEPFIQDNLIELRKKMEENPDIPVTLSEGCCMVCDPCNIYHPDEHICYAGHIKNQLRDLLMLEKLDLKPGATLSARKLYKRVYERITSLREICAWGDERETAIFWSPCKSWNKTNLQKALEHFSWWSEVRKTARKRQSLSQ